ncbi:helix-turn-helix domain-containing protein [Sphingomonas sp. CROZ-RG-20F-R02-07]|uniref:helix-turn-helix domain-containing protein n=1 Tax=Sphingomonas sp. CROZ-RG-20F-R02-07 TaxID=2914832 RepID=UPI001F5A077F
MISPGSVSIASVLEHVAFETEFAVSDIIGRSRKLHLVRTRYAAAWLARRHTGKTLTQIGRAFGGRDHSTVTHEITRAEQLRGVDDYFCWLTDQLDEQLARVAGEDAAVELADSVIRHLADWRGRPENLPHARYSRRQGMTLWSQLALRVAQETMA